MILSGGQREFYALALDAAIPRTSKRSMSQLAIVVRLLKMVHLSCHQSVPSRKTNWVQAGTANFVDVRAKVTRRANISYHHYHIISDILYWDLVALR